MLNNGNRTRERESNLTILPENYYFDTMRPYMQKCMREAKYDEVLINELELIQNRADGHASRKEYSLLAEDFDQLATVLLSPKSGYRDTYEWKQATIEERTLIEDLGDKCQQLLTIAKCTKEPEHKDGAFQARERLGYNPEKKENIQ